MGQNININIFKRGSLIDPSTNDIANPITKYKTIIAAKIAPKIPITQNFYIVPISFYMLPN